ncbi:MAG: DeoR/GlpR family DNA-binding transcription regulator [Bacteroidota bacterium]
MLKEERHRIILNEVRIHNRVLLTDIAEFLKVSPDTIRRDIKILHEKKELKKVHGGAISLGFNNTSTVRPDIYALEKKTRIVEKALTLLKDGQVVLLSGGTTNVELARLLPPSLKLTCFTPSLPIAGQLLTKSNVETIFIGGRLSRDSQIAIGGNALNMLSLIRADICFLGTNSIHAEEGLTEFDWDIVQIKKAMIKASRKVVAPCISEKLNSTRRYRICDIEEVDVLVTELEPSDTRLGVFATKDLELL